MSKFHTKNNAASASTRRRHVTLELIRKRSEHNECLVSNLEEIALHQEELETIGPILGRACGKTLKILLLQNNVIGPILSTHPSDMRSFKCLEYLNVALNNITVLESCCMDHMEHLRKLDLTLNFIDFDTLEESMDCLGQLRSLRELFMIGNPCCAIQRKKTENDDEPRIVLLEDSENGDANETKYTARRDLNPHLNGSFSNDNDNVNWTEDCFRSYVISKVPQLKSLDGKQIMPSERIKATQKLPYLEKMLSELAKRCAQQKKEKENKAQIDVTCTGRGSEASDGTKITTDISSQEVLGDQETTTHCPEDRLRISHELAQQKAEKEKNENANRIQFKGDREFAKEQKKTIQKAREREEKGDIKQCNEGRWTFQFHEDKKPGYLTLDITLQKHLSSDLIDIDIHPTYVSVVIKSKVLRLKLPSEVRSEACTAKRSTTTGHLLISMPKCDPTSYTIGKKSECIEKHESKTSNSNMNKSTTMTRKYVKRGTALQEEVMRVAYSSSTNHKQQLKGPVQIKGIVKESCHDDGRAKFTHRTNGLDMVENKTSRTFASQQSTEHADDNDDEDEDSPPLLF